MSAFVIPLAAFLAGVFAVSAVGKLRSADRGRAAFDALQLPVRHPDAAAIGIIVVELVVAIGLLTTSGWVFVAAATAAVLLTGGLLLVVTRAHRLGVTDDCGCFGDWLPSAIGPRLITRNAILLAAALGVLIPTFWVQAVAGVPMGVPVAVTALDSAAVVIGATAAAAMIGLAVWSIVRSAVGAPATAAAPARGVGAVLLPDRAEIVDVLAPGVRARLVFFVSPGCHACETALAALQVAEDDVSALVDVYVVQRAVSGAADVESTHPLPRTARFALDVGGSLASHLGTGPGTPVAALIGTDGTQAGPLAIGSDEVVQLLDSILALAETPSA